MDKDFAEADPECDTPTFDDLHPKTDFDKTDTDFNHWKKFIAREEPAWRQSIEEALKDEYPGIENEPERLKAMSEKEYEGLLKVPGA